MKDYVNFVLVGDKNYVAQIGVTITSIVLNLDKSKTGRFFLFTTGFELKDIEKLSSIKNCEIHNIDMEQYLYLFKSIDRSTFKLNYISLATYFRILMLQILPQDVDKCFYIDADMIVNDDLSTIYNNFKNNFLAAVVVEVLAMQYKNDILQHCYKLPEFNNFSNNSIKYPYFNAGFFLLNVRLAKELNLFNNAMKVLENNPSLPYADQDLLNIVFVQQHSDKIIYLNPSYNVFCDMKYSVVFNNAFYEEHVIKKAFFSPKIYHFGGENKPWINNKVRHYYKVWWFYCRLSPFAFLQQPNEEQYIVNTKKRVELVNTEQTVKIKLLGITVIKIKKYYNKTQYYFLGVKFLTIY